MIEIDECDKLNKYPDKEIIKLNYTDTYNVEYKDYVLLRLEDADETKSCVDCVFGYDNDFYDMNCILPTNGEYECEAIRKGKVFKIVRHSKDFKFIRPYSYNELKSKICNPDVCLFHKDDLSCEDEDNPCLINIITTD